ncbi:MAG: GntR family transcriptional regulator [Candidatus Promineifilaceae bacterium]
MQVIEESSTPLYLQLEEILRGQIDQGSLAPGDALPSENELVDAYRVSRTTVRKALDRLADDGVVVRVQGKGTYVSKAEVTQDLRSLRTISEVLTQAGLIPEVEVAAVDVNHAAPLQVLEELNLPEGSMIVQVKRRHLVNGEPIAYAVIYLSNRFQWRFSAEELRYQSIYTWLETQEQVLVEKGVQVICAQAASDEVARALALEPGAPVLKVVNTSTAETGIPIEHTEFYFPPERYVLAVTLRRTHVGFSLEDVRGEFSR